MWPFCSPDEMWTGAKVDNVAAVVRDFALRDGSTLDALRFRQKIGDYKAMLCGTPILSADAKEMAEALAKCFDRRSPMIQALSAKEWRWSLEAFHASKEDKWLAKQMLADGMWDSSWLSGGWAPRSSEMIRLLDDPAWRESLKVAETPVEAEYAGVRERSEAMRPAPAGFYSARTGYEGEYRPFFGFRS